MFRNSYQTTSQEKKAISSKYVENNTEQYAKSNPKISRGIRDNKRKMRKTEMDPIRTIDSNAPSIPKDFQKPLETGLKGLGKGKVHNEREISPTVLKEMINNSIKEAMQNVVKQCKIESPRFPMYHGNKGRQHASSNKGKPDRSRRKTLQSKATAGTNHRTEENYNKQSKRRSKSANGGRMDNRKMTGNVNIFICSEATDATQGKQQESSEDRPYEESSLGRIPNSTETMDQTSSTSFGKLEKSISKTERPLLKEPLVSNEGEISSNNSDVNYTENALVNYSTTDKATQLVVPNRDVIDPGLSAGDYAPNSRNAKKLESNTHRSNEVRLQPKSKVCDKVRVRGWNYINKEHGTIPQDVGHNQKYHWKESHVKCFCRDQQKFTLLDSNEGHTNRKIIKCPFIIDEKPEQPHFPCNCIKREKGTTLPDNSNCHEKSKIFSTCEVSKEASADRETKVKETEKDLNATTTVNKQSSKNPQQLKEKPIEKSTSGIVNNVQITAASRNSNEKKQSSTDKGKVSAGESFRDVKTSKIISVNDTDNTLNKIDQKDNDFLAKNGEPKKQGNISPGTINMEKKVENPLQKKQIPKNSITSSNLVNKTNDPTLKVIKPSAENNVIRNASKVKTTTKESIKNESVIKKSLQDVSSRTKRPEESNKTKQMPQGRSKNDGSPKTTIPSRRAGVKGLKQSTQKILELKQTDRSKPSTLPEAQNDRENKPLQFETAHDTKNVQHKQEAEKSDSHEKTFREKVKASLLCRSVRRLVDRLKRGKSPAKTENVKTEVPTDTSEDNQLNFKENKKPQVRNEINTGQQKIGAKGVGQKMNISKTDGKKFDVKPIGDIPITPVVRQDKGDGPNYITPPKAAISQRTENKLNVGQKQKAKLLAAISKKKAFVTMQQHASPILHRRDVREEKKEDKSEKPNKMESTQIVEPIGDLESGKIIEHSDPVKVAESSIIIDVEKSRKIVKIPKAPELKDPAKIVKQPKKESEEISKSFEPPTVPLKATKDESVKIRESSTISKPLQDTAAQITDGNKQSEILKKKPETDETTQEIREFEKDSRSQDLQQRASTTLKTEVKSVCVSQIEKEELQNDSEQLTVEQCDFSKIYHHREQKSLRHTTSSTSFNDCNCIEDNNKEVKDIHDVCQISHCDRNVHFPKSTLKKSKENLSRSKYFPDKKLTVNRCPCVRCCKWEESNNYDRTLHHIDTHIKMERHRCKKTLVCLYCDKPRDKCICRIPIERCSRCKASKDHDTCSQDQRASYRPSRSFPTDADNNQEMYATSSKSRKESQRPFTTDLLPKYHSYLGEDCHCHERLKYEKLEDTGDLSHQRSTTFSNVVNEIQRKASDITGCSECGKTPCCCSVDARNQEKNVSSEIHRLNNNDGFICKSDYYAPDEWRVSRATGETKRRKPSAKCYYCKNWPCFCITLREENKPRPCRCADSRSCRKEKVSRCPRNNEELVCVR